MASFCRRLTLAEDEATGLRGGSELVSAELVLLDEEDVDESCTEGPSEEEPKRS